MILDSSAATTIMNELRVPLVVLSILALDQRFQFLADLLSPLMVEINPLTIDPDIRGFRICSALKLFSLIGPESILFIFMLFTLPAARRRHCLVQPAIFGSGR